MKIFNRVAAVVLAFAFIFVLAGGFTDPRIALRKDFDTVITFWTPPFVEAESIAWFEKWTDAYNDTNDDGIYVDLVFVPEDTWEQKITAARSNGTAPDLVFANYAKIPLEGIQGYHTDLTPYFTEEEWSDIHSYAENLINVNGSRYVYPAFVEPYSILYYSKSKFAAAGLDPEKPPESWTELIEYSRVLTNDKTGNEKVYGIQLPPAGQLGWVMWGFQGMAGTELLNDNWDTAVTDTVFNRRLFEMFRTLYSNGYTPKSSGYSYTEINQFGNGRVAMQLGGSWSIGQIKNNYPQLLSDLGVAKCPTPDGENDISTAALGGWGMTISTDCKQVDAALKFMKYLLAGAPAIMAEFFKSLGYSKFSGRKSVDAKIMEDEQAKSDPYNKYLLEEVLPLAVPEPGYPWVFSDAFAISLQAYMIGTEDIGSTMTKLTAKMRAYIDNEECAGKNPRKAA